MNIEREGLLIGYRIEEQVQRDYQCSQFQAESDSPSRDQSLRS